MCTRGFRKSHFGHLKVAAIETGSMNDKFLLHDGSDSPDSFEGPFSLIAPHFLTTTCAL